MFERNAQALPLLGKRILVTRTRAQSQSLSKCLQAKGATPVEFPTIRIVPPSSWETLDAALGRLFLAAAQQLPYYSWLIFTSANGVHIFCQRMQSLGLQAQRLEQVRIAAIGPATAAALRDYDLMLTSYQLHILPKALLQACWRMSKGAESLWPANIYFYPVRLRHANYWLASCNRREQSSTKSPPIIRSQHQTMMSWDVPY